MLAALGDIADRLLEGGPIGDLVAGHAEFRADRVGHLAADQGDGRGHRVAGLQAADHHLQRLGQLQPEHLGAALGLDLQVDERRDQARGEAGPEADQSVVGEGIAEQADGEADHQQVQAPFLRVVLHARADDQVGQVAAPALAVLLEPALLAQLQHQLAQRLGAFGGGEPAVDHALGRVQPHQAVDRLPRREHGGEDQDQERKLRVDRGQVHGARPADGRDRSGLNRN